jgi:hypothetical protein
VESSITGLPSLKGGLDFGKRHPFRVRLSGTRLSSFAVKIDCLVGGARGGAIHKFCISICQQKKRPDERKFPHAHFASVYNPVDAVDKNALFLEN